MKVLSLLQPWASLVLLGAKRFEVRSWQTSFRGELLIHASAAKPSKREKTFFESADFFRDHIHDTDMLPYGAIICKVNLAEIYETGPLLKLAATAPYHTWQQELAFDDFSTGRFAWKFDEVTPLEHYLPMKGSLGLWEYKGMI